MANDLKQTVLSVVATGLVLSIHSGASAFTAHGSYPILEPNPAIVRVLTYDDVSRSLKELEDQYSKALHQFGNDPSKAPFLKGMAEKIQKLKDALKASQDAAQQAAQKTLEEQKKASDATARQEQVKQLNARIEELRKQQAAQQAADQNAKDAQAKEVVRQEELRKQDAALKQQDQASQQAAKDAKLKELTQRIDALRKQQTEQQALEDQKKHAVEQTAKNAQQQQLSPNFGTANSQQSTVQLGSTMANSTPQIVPTQQSSGIKRLQDLKAALDTLMNKGKSSGAVSPSVLASTSGATTPQSNLEILKKKINGLDNATAAPIQQSNSKPTASSFATSTPKQFDNSDNSVGTVAGTLIFHTKTGARLALNSFNSGTKYGKTDSNYQCVELIHRYLSTLGLDSAHPLGDGRSTAQNAAMLNPNVFQFVSNGMTKIDALPREGAILSINSIYGKSGQIEEEGHVGIVSQAGFSSNDPQTYRVTLFDQNWPSREWKTIEFTNNNGSWNGYMKDQNAVGERIDVVGWANPRF